MARFEDAAQGGNKSFRDPGAGYLGQGSGDGEHGCCEDERPGDAVGELFALAGLLLEHRLHAFEPDVIWRRFEKFGVRLLEKDVVED